MYTLIATAKLNGIGLQAWLADVFRRIADDPASRLDQLLPPPGDRTAGLGRMLTQ